MQWVHAYLLRLSQICFFLLPVTSRSLCSWLATIIKDILEHWRTSITTFISHQYNNIPESCDFTPWKDNKCIIYSLCVSSFKHFSEKPTCWMLRKKGLFTQFFPFWPSCPPLLLPTHSCSLSVGSSFIGFTGLKAQDTRKLTGWELNKVRQVQQSLRDYETTTTSSFLQPASSPAVMSRKKTHNSP